MVTVIGLWEDVWLDTERSERRLWKQTIQAFKVDRWVMVPSNGKEFTSPTQYDTMQEALDAVEGKKIFLIPPERVGNSLDLVKYEHPEDATYVFGNVPENLVSYIRPEDDVVSIYTPAQTDMFGGVALAAVLYDRHFKHVNR